MREREPVYQADSGHWYLTRHGDASVVLRDPRFARQAPQGSNLLGASIHRPSRLEVLIRHWLVFRDPPGHTALRTWWSRHLNQGVFEGLAPRIPAIVEGLLDGIEGDACIDFVSALAYPLPVLVIAELLSLPTGDLHLYRRWSEAMTRALDRGLPQDMQAADPAIAEMLDYLGQAVRERRRRPGDDLLTAVTQARINGHSLGDEEILAGLAFLLWAGHETTRSLIGNGLWLLLRHGNQRRRLLAQTDLMDNAVEEFLRFESPIQMLSRWTRITLDIGGRRVPQDSLVVCLIGAANRDPAVFHQPEQLDIRRRDNRHLAFGRGPHHCMGAWLARCEARIAISTVLRHYPNLAFAGTRPRWRHHGAFRSLETLPVFLAG